MPSPTTAAAAVATARCPPPRTKKRTASVASVDGVNDSKPFRPTSITRNMLIVYYDSYVQGFFDDMVRFISSSRNLMRKAKMAAKVAQIKRLAEMETTNSDGQKTDEKPPMETLPSLRFINSRQLGSSGLRYGLPGAKSGPPDVYDELDKALEFVQSTCEHGAHQFLRDANCNEELNKIQKRMEEVLETAKKEAERIARDDPELAKETSEQYKPRTRRPITMSRNLVGNQKDDRGPGGDGHVRLEIADFVRNCPLLPSGGRIEVDLAVDSLVKAGADSTVDVDSALPRMPLPQDASSGSMRHQRIIAAE
ncbi:hypothetical protein ESCO_005192 [Escovopsis weberi]|uniref:Uncharacterized protein n=1 Tax=Escovopsis weberi TaxID=150374 RepID=A0A0M9VVW0_ESCWE|nr:hypothetical protein ESCO_005192 [Escovopsis weberi]